MSEAKLYGRRDGAVAHIVFNNPEKHNAVSLDMWQRYTELLKEYEADDGIRVLVLSGAGGKAFVSGADISKFEKERSSEETVANYNKISKGAYDALTKFPKPTIAKINGYCIGGGMNVAVGCDLRFAEDTSKFAIPAAKLGLGYGYYGVNRLAHLIGPARAMEMFYTARQFPAVEAYEMGLLNRIMPTADLETYVNETAQRICENAPLTIATIKAVTIEMAKSPETPDHARLDQMVLDCFNSEDYIEGRRAFMEKRKPQFKGR